MTYPGTQKEKDRWLEEQKQYSTWQDVKECALWFAAGTLAAVLLGLIGYF